MFHYIFWFALAFPQKHHNARGEYTAPKNNLKKEVCNSVGYNYRNDLSIGYGIVLWGNYNYFHFEIHPFLMNVISNYSLAVG